MLCDILFDGIQGHRLRIRINPYCSPSSPTLRFQPEDPLPFLRTCTPLSSSRHHDSNTFSSEFPSFCEMTRKRSVHSNRCAVGITVIAQDSPSLVLSVTLPLSSNRTCPSFWMSVLGMVQCTVFLVSESKRLPVVVEEEDSVSRFQEKISVSLLRCVQNRFCTVFRRICNAFTTTTVRSRTRSVL